MVDERLARRARWIGRLLAGAAGIWALYLLPANLWLNTPLGEAPFNRNPAKFMVRWTAAFTPWPGRIHLYGVEVGGQSRAIQWHASLPSVAASYRLRPLGSRTVWLERVRAIGGEYRQRRRLAPGEDPGPLAKDGPGIPGYANPPEAPPEPSSPRSGQRPAWTVIADRIDWRLTGIWIDVHRLAGPMRVTASMSLVTPGPLEFPAMTFEMESGDLWNGEHRVFEQVGMRADLRVDPFVPRGRRASDLMDALSGRLDLSARAARFGFLESYFRSVDWLKFDGTGPLGMTLRVDKGVLSEGTRFELERNRLDFAFLDSRLTGWGTLRGEVVRRAGRPVSQVIGVVDEFEIAHEGFVEPYIRGRNFLLEAESTSLRLADPFTDLTVQLVLPESEIPDLSFYNIYFPPESRLSIVSGVGRIRYRLEGSQEEGSLRGDMEVEMDDLRMRFEDLTFGGNVRIMTRLRNGSPAERRFDISGTRVEFSHAGPPWRGWVELPDARMAFTHPAHVEARIRLHLQDTVPLVRLFDAHTGLPKLVQRFLTIRDVTGGATLAAQKASVRIRDLELSGKGLRALADLDLSARGRSGILYVRLRGFPLGVELVEGRKRDFRLFRPLSWFEKARARRNGAAPRSAVAAK